MTGITLSWFLHCAAKVAAAQLRLGVMHEHGLGVEFNPKVPNEYANPLK